MAFVVAGAPGNDDLSAAFEGLDARLERWRLPQIERIDRLHIVVAVEQDARRVAVGTPVAAFADYDRMASGRTHTGFESKAAQISRDMFGGGAAVFRIGRIGRHRLDAQEREQAIEACLEIAIDTVKNCRQSFGGCHVSFLALENTSVSRRNSCRVHYRRSKKRQLLVKLYVN